MDFQLFQGGFEMAMMEQIDERYLTLREVRSRYGLCASTVYNNIQAGKFPAPLKFGKSSRWRLSELAAWERSLPRGGAPRESV